MSYPATKARVLQKGVPNSRVQPTPTRIIILSGCKCPLAVRSVLSLRGSTTTEVTCVHYSPREKTGPAVCSGGRSWWDESRRNRGEFARNVPARLVDTCTVHGLSTDRGCREWLKFSGSSLRKVPSNNPAGVSGTKQFSLSGLALVELTAARQGIRADGTVSGARPSRPYSTRRSVTSTRPFGYRRTGSSACSTSS